MFSFTPTTQKKQKNTKNKKIRNSLKTDLIAVEVSEKLFTLPFTKL